MWFVTLCVQNKLIMFVDNDFKIDVRPNTFIQKKVNRERHLAFRN